MAKVRYIGTAPVEVVCNGHPRGGHLGTVGPDEVLEVDDEVYKAHAWPETRWTEVEAPGAKKSTKASKGGE